MTKNPTLAIRPILEQMAKDRLICYSSIESTIHAFGETPIVNKSNLRRAARYRGTAHFRAFCASWLGWPQSLVDNLFCLEERIIWRDRHLGLTFEERRRRAVEINVVAAHAWIRKMRKP